MPFQITVVVLHDRPRASEVLVRFLRQLTGVAVIVVDGSATHMHRNASELHSGIRFDVLQQHLLGAGTYKRALELVNDSEKYIAVINSDLIADDEIVDSFRMLSAEFAERLSAHREERPYVLVYAPKEATLHRFVDGDDLIVGRRQRSRQQPFRRKLITVVGLNEAGIDKNGLLCSFSDALVETPVAFFAKVSDLRTLSRLDDRIWSFVYLALSLQWHDAKWQVEVIADGQCGKGARVTSNNFLIDHARSDALGAVSICRLWSELGELRFPNWSLDCNLGRICFGSGVMSCMMNSTTAQQPNLIGCREIRHIVSSLNMSSPFARGGEKSVYAVFDHGTPLVLKRMLHKSNAPSVCFLLVSMCEILFHSS
jgi:hypothetical protein